jgi:hypothetical protein
LKNLTEAKLPPGRQGQTRSVAFVHPDLGIGGAERLVVDAAVGLQSLGHKIVMYTSHHDPSHCFDETRNGQLEVKVVIPHFFFGRREFLGCNTLAVGFR